MISIGALSDELRVLSSRLSVVGHAVHSTHRFKTDRARSPHANRPLSRAP